MSEECSILLLEMCFYLLTTHAIVAGAICSPSERDTDAREL
jgi:hypothetical protein